MRILGKECRKIWNLRLLLVICIFTVLYYVIYMQICEYPSGGQMTDSPYDIPFAAELVEELGATVSIHDWSKVEDKTNALKKEFNALLTSDEVLREAGITTYDEMKRRSGEINDKPESEWTKNERAVSEAIKRLEFENQSTTQLSCKIQYIESLSEFEGIQYGVREKDASRFVEEFYGDMGASRLFKNAIEKRCTKEEVSLLPQGVMYILQEDMWHMAILLVICFLILMVPYQIRERIRGVTPLYATTHTGRKIFGIQFKAGLISCGLVGMIQLLVYLGIYMAKGLLPFWKCPAWPYAYNAYWLDDISFGAYMLIYMLMVWLFAMAGLVLVYWIGRKAVNYIVGIAISIPVGMLISIASLWLFQALFRMEETDTAALWEIPVLAGWFLGNGILLAIRLKRDTCRDIL